MDTEVASHVVATQSYDVKWPIKFNL